MNSHEWTTLLRERATDVDDVQVDRVSGVHRRVRAARRHRAAGVAAAAVVLACAVGLALTVPGGDPRSEEPVAPPTQTPADALDRYRIVPDDNDGSAVPLDPGPWLVEGVGSGLMPRVLLDIPPGYVGTGPYLFADRKGPMRSVGYWSPTEVYENPCQSNNDADLVSIRTVDELAEALASQPQSRTTAPVPISLDGYEGVSLTLTPEVDVKSCTDHVFYVFNTVNGDRWMDTTGETDRYWILDVEGQVLLLNTAVDPGATEMNVADLEQIVESAQFQDE